MPQKERQDGRMCKLHLTDCGQKLPVLPLPQAASLKLSLCSSALNNWTTLNNLNYWTIAVFFLFNPYFLFNKGLSTSPVQSVKIGLNK